MFDAKCAQQQRAQHAHADRRAARSSAGGSWPTTATVLAQLGARRRRARGRARTRPASLFAQAVGYSIAAARAQRRARALARRRAARAADRADARSSASSSAPPRRRRRLHDARPQGPAGRARSELAGRAGSVVALDPRTGAIKVMYANPSYNDNHPEPPARASTTLQPLHPGPLSARARRSRS